MRAAFRIAALVLASACSTSGFDDLQNNAPVDSNGPDEVSSELYPVAIAGVPGLPGLRFTVLGGNPTSLSTYVYGPQDGDLFSQGLDLQGPPVDSVNPPAFIGASSEDDESGLVFLGNANNQILVFDAGDADNREIRPVDTIDPSECPSAAPDLENFGRAMLFANTDLGDPEKADLIVFGDAGTALQTDIMIFVDYEPGDRACDRCSLLGTNGEVFLASALAAIDINEDDEDGDEIVMSIREGTDPPGLGPIGFEVFKGSQALSGAIRCFENENPLISIENDMHGSNMESDIDFGGAIAIGNFDGITAPEQDDIAFTTPQEEHVKVFFNPEPGDAGQPFEFETPPTPPGQRQLAISSADFDSDGTDEILVASPEASTDGVSKAGEVLIFRVAGNQVPAPVRLSDARPETNQSYGRVLTTGSFQRGEENSDIILVGAVQEVFTIFTASERTPDPRFPPPPPE